MACFIFSGGCQKEIPEEIDTGAFTGSVYRNDYFGMTITIPPDWNIQEKQAMQTLKNLGKNAIKDDKNLKAVMQASEPRTVNLFAVFKHPLGSPVPFNPSFICLAERVDHFPGIKRGKDYHYHTRKILESSQMRVQFPIEITAETIGRVEFDVLYSETSFGANLIKQKQYAAVIKGYVLLLVITFVEEDQETALKEILKKLTFNMD